MSKEEFKKLILHRGKIDRYIFLLSFFVQNTFIKDIFRVLQEIDNTVYKYHYPMEINFLIYEELIDQKNKISIFTASTISELYIGKKVTMKKLNKFFQKERFDIIYDQYLKLEVRIFIRDFVNAKVKYLTEKTL